MIARAPGKLVLSGAYAVLWGAPAIVTAVDRYVSADSSRPAGFVTPEVLAALGVQTPAPYFDASELRSERGKLGLGSSAAILVASLGALQASPLGEVALMRLVARAVHAHREAQGGGSGIDVLASALGGTLVARTTENVPHATHVTLPAGLDWSVWFSGHSTSTSMMLSQVKRLEAVEPQCFQTIFAPHLQASEDAARAVEANDANGLLSALEVQRQQLFLLGEAAKISIVTREMKELHEVAASESALCMPSGAGGGDVLLRIGRTPPSASFRLRATELGFEHLPLELGARGLHFTQPQAS